MNGDGIQYSYPRVSPANTPAPYNYQPSKAAQEEPIVESKAVQRDLEAMPAKKKLKHAILAQGKPAQGHPALMRKVEAAKMSVDRYASLLCKFSCVLAIASAAVLCFALHSITEARYATATG